MCERYSIAIDEPGKIEEQFHAPFVRAYKSPYSAAPSQDLPVILNQDPTKTGLAKWGIPLPWVVKTKRR